MGQRVPAVGEGVQFTTHDGVACVPVQREIAGRDAGQRCGGFAASGAADLNKRGLPPLSSRHEVTAAKRRASLGIANARISFAKQAANPEIEKPIHETTESG